MGSVAVVTDTCHYLPRQLVAARGLHEVSLHVHWDGREDREAELPDFDAYYRHLRTTETLPTTSQPSIGEFLAVYEPLPAGGGGVCWGCWGRLGAGGRAAVPPPPPGPLPGTAGAAGRARARWGGRGGERVHV